jgi:LTXXQ motif family protein
MSKFQRVVYVATISLFAFTLSLANSEAGGPGGGPGGGHGGSIAGGHGASIGGGGRGYAGPSGFRAAPGGGSFYRGTSMFHSAPTARSFSNFRASPSFRSSQGFVASGRYAGSRHYRSSGVAQYKSNGQYSHRAMSGGKQLTVRSREVGSTASTKGGRVQPQLGSKALAKAQFDHRNRNLVTGTVHGVKNASVLRNEAFARHSIRHANSGALKHASFHGKFADKNWDKSWNKNWDKHWHHDGWHYPYNDWYWRHHHPFIVIGWFGPLFWPYAYWDFVDYTFWPYEYDAFWPYAYDDLYVGIFGPYAYEGPAYASVPSGKRARTAQRRSAATAVVCNAQAPDLTDWPIQQIADTIKPDEAQQAGLMELKDATAKAVNALQSACPNDLPSTPTGRLAAMRQRIGAMLLAIGIVQAPLQRFYDALTDEQRARFNVIRPEAEVARASTGGKNLPDLSQVCGEQTVKGLVPTDHLVQRLEPTNAQRTALDALNEAANKAADHLKANCPLDQTLTPPGRLAAMEKRLNAIMEAIKIVQPTLESFYGSLTDEQKARFNQLGPRPS